MANINNWSDDYWLMLVQVYLRKPVGVKPMYCRDTVNLAMELHVHPKVLVSKMRVMANMPTPRIERILNTYRNKPKSLARAVKRLRDMKGFNNATDFYEGVALNETFELYFKPAAQGTKLTPAMLTMVLELYFRLTPLTMVAETPEVIELAKLIKLEPQDVAEALSVFQFCDPYLNRKGDTTSPLKSVCQKIWNEYASGNPEALGKQVELLREYFT